MEAGFRCVWHEFSALRKAVAIARCRRPAFEKFMGLGEFMAHLKAL